MGWLAAPLASHAQAPAAVRGSVAGPGGAAVEFATITLHRAADSVVVRTEFSDAQGTFRLDAPAGKIYRVSAMQVGYGRYWSAPFEVPAAGLVLPAIRLAPSQATALKEVTVTGRKPLYERRADRTVVNVADSPLSSGATTLDVLARSPGVTLSATNDLGLRGRQGLLVVIDGKRTPLTGNDLAEYLRSLPAEQLQSIELITNPPASFDAQGGAGVIAINLKKDQRLGTNGTANASLGYSEQAKFTGGLALNHRRKNLNVYGTYAYTDRRYFARLDLTRQFAATATLPAGGLVQSNDQLAHLRSHTARVGLDLNLSKRTLLGASITGLASTNDLSTASQAVTTDELGQPTDRFRARTDWNVSRPSGSANLNLRHAFADSASAAALSADADYARYALTRLSDQYVVFDTPGRAADQLSGDQHSRLSIGAAKVDFSQPLPHRSRLEVGAKATQVVSDNDVAFTSTMGGQTVPRPDISSQFSYHENVNAAYASLRGALAGATLQAGLRAEQTNILATQAGATVREQHYLQLFPSALAERTFNDRHALTLAVARRIDRPNYQQLNPLRTYADATSYLAGNPNLLASTSYNFELTHTYRQKFSTGLAYSRSDLPIVNVVQPSPDGGRLVVSQNVNLSTRHFYTLTLTAPLTLTKWWTLYANALVYYNRYVGELNGTALDRGRVACNLTANSSFTLPHGWSAELNGFYESREVYGFQVIQARGQVAAGLQKSLWNKQGTFRLNVADIFYTTPNRATSTYDNFTETYYSRLDTRIVTAALTYRFGNNKVAAARRRAAGADEELRRAAGQ
ncbi:outer membrane beta-barrel family protein [Hymenobacter ginsengisoli]|uniref:Outer membrane beta-barrel family protein n=2 Tax=Hymenobacteraceae TaxID=1853232 RepID=A0ABP8QB57_9BACT|nr:outer membrane beta-barrel protein [Hymenobacter sp. KCTC 23674]